MDDITIASTTDTADEMKAAIAHGTEVPADDLEIETPDGDDAPVTAAPDGEKKDEKPKAEAKPEEKPKAEAKPDARPDSKPKPVRPKRSDFQTDEEYEDALAGHVAGRRIGKLTWEREEAVRRADAANKSTEELKARIADLEKKAAEPKKDDAKVEAKPQPKAEDFETTEEWLAALVAWQIREDSSATIKEATAAAKKIIDDARAESAKAESDAAATAAFEVFQETRADAAKRHEDFDEVIQDAAEMPITPVMHMAMMEANEDEDVPGLGHEMAYYLAQHPNEVTRLMALDPGRQTKEMGRLEERVKRDVLAAAPPKAEDKPAAGEKKAAADRRVPKAEAPIEPVGARSTNSQTDLDKIEDQREFNRRRNEQERNRRRLR